MSLPQTRAKRRPNDPARRQRIIEAAARVVAEHGVDALTFRAVADAAKVPLGSTTYYFADKDDLLVSTIRTIRERNEKSFHDLLQPLVAEHGLAGGLAALVEEVTVRQHPQLILEYGLYLSTLHRPALRKEIAQWRMDAVARPYCDDQTARLLGFTLEGILLQSVMEDVMFFATDVEPMLAKITDGK
ncbi:TetR/AcrR family transcriptional regulator [Arthrobacter sp. GCM10027362]|uniref:TetR/AcrR family transcriptional regulator n=1 Tax=Arthrobacter sp. GCM10027362 TaxID=3273379 RepID=UPI003629659E